MGGGGSLVKCLLDRCGDLSLDLLYSCKNLSRWRAFAKPALSWCGGSADLVDNKRSFHWSVVLSIGEFLVK